MGYGKYDPAAEREAEEQASASRWYRVPQKAEGENVFFCPPWSESARLPWFETKVHWKIAPEAVLCPRTQGKPCPVCDVNFDLFARKDNSQALEISKDIRQKELYFYNILAPLDLGQAMLPGNPQPQYFGMYKGDATKEIKIVPYPISWSLHDMLKKIRAMNGDIFDPMCGNLIQLTKVASGNPKVPSKVQAVPYPQKIRLEDRLLPLMSKLPDLSAQLELRAPEELKSLIDTYMASAWSKSASTTVHMPGTPAPFSGGYPMNPSGMQPTPMHATVAPSPSSGGTLPSPVIIGSPTPVTPTPVPATVQVAVQATPNIAPAAPALTGNVQALSALEEEIRKKHQGK